MVEVSLCANHKYHVLQVGKVVHCNGCLANKMFLSILLPFYVLFISPNESMYWIGAIVAYTGLQASFFGIWMTTGRKVFARFSSILTVSFLIWSHYFLIFGHFSATLSNTQLWSLILVAVVPQFSMYSYKILTQREFKLPKLKFLIRMMFIHGYFFSLLLFRSQPIPALLFIFIVAPAFLIIRKISGNRVLDKYEFGTLDPIFIHSSNQGKQPLSWTFDNFAKSPLYHNIAAEQDSCCGDCAGCTLLGAGACIGCGTC